ncbi:MAG: hypothetical protein VYE40_10615 [Myxococcota bacterium]|nr:hypothetical protein [Myxococcota bacterium]
MRELFRVFSHLLLATCLMFAPGVAIADPATSSEQSSGGGGGDGGGDSAPFTELSVSTADAFVTTGELAMSTPVTIESTTNAFAVTTTEALTQTAYGLAIAMALGLLTVLLVGGAVILTITATVPQQAMARLDAYVRTNSHAIRQGLAVGAGGAIDDLATWFGVPEELRPTFGEALRARRMEISWALGHDTNDFAMSVWIAMLRDDTLAAFLREQGILAARYYTGTKKSPLHYGQGALSSIYLQKFSGSR